MWAKRLLGEMSKMQGMLPPEMCRGSFQTRQSPPLCNTHFCVEDVQEAGVGSHRKRKSERAKQPRALKIPKNICALNRDVIYEPKCLNRIILRGNEARILRFDGKSFFLDRERVHVDEIRRAIGLDVCNEDVFRIKSSGYMEYRQRTGRLAPVNTVLVGLLTVYRGKTRYFFGH